MFAFALILLSLPVSNPFPDLFRLSMGIIAVFSVLLIIAKLKRHPKRGLSIFFSLLIIGGVILAGLSGFYSFYGPSTVDPFIPRTNIHDVYFSIYLFIRTLNIIIFLLVPLLALASIFLLFMKKAK